MHGFSTCAPPITRLLLQTHLKQPGMSALNQQQLTISLRFLRLARHPLLTAGLSLCRSGGVRARIGGSSADRGEFTCSQSLTQPCIEGVKVCVAFYCAHGRRLLGCGKIAKTPPTREPTVATVQNPENLQRAAVELERGKSYREVGELFGVTRECIRLWTKLPDWPRLQATAKAIVGEEVVRSNIVHLHPDRIDTPAPKPVAAPESGELVDHAIEVLRSALEQGDVRAATWVLERVDPERFGTPKDRQVMAEIRKTAAQTKGGPVRVTIAAPRRREQSA